MGRKNYCINISQTASNEEVWKAVRTVIGPVPTYAAPTDLIPVYKPYIDLMVADIAEYNAWVLATGISSVSFKKWLVWYLMYNTTDYNNLRANRVDAKVGRSYAPCPYDTECSEQRSMDLLGTVPAKVVHELNAVHYYMDASSRGAKWAWQCTFENCPYNLSHGKKYFYI